MVGGTGPPGTLNPDPNADEAERLGLPAGAVSREPVLALEAFDEVLRLAGRRFAMIRRVPLEVERPKTPPPAIEIGQLKHVSEASRGAK